MIKSYRYRIYPNKKQMELFQKTFGCARYVYNYYLNKKKELYDNEKKSMSCYECIKDLTNLKSENQWLKEVDKNALQNSLNNLDEAYQHFFKEHKHYPRFKTKKTHHFSYRTSFNNNNIEVKNGKIKLPKVKWVKTKDKMIPEGRILNATISKVPSGKYYVSICCTDIDVKRKPITNNCIGIDLGIKQFATTSNGEKYVNHKFLKQSLSKLSKIQHSYDRKKDGSSNKEKARIKLARIHEHIANQRRDYLHKLSTKLINENDIICIETLAISEMIKNSSTSREFNDVSWYSFIRKLKYKADLYGKKLISVGTYFPSSQICHCCGERSVITKDTKVRDWVCNSCGVVLDRDVNAAINILNEGLKIMNNNIRTAGTAGIA